MHCRCVRSRGWREREAHKCKPPSGTRKARRQQKEATDTDKNNEIEGDRNETKQLWKNKGHKPIQSALTSHRCVPPRSAIPARLVTTQEADAHEALVGTNSRVIRD
jgi:hypothetical protein